jgi:hypothetical protein
MRHIILVLIALMAMGGLLPAAMGLPPAPFEMTDPEMADMLTTPSMAAFLNDSWTPTSFVAPVPSDNTPFTKKSFANNTTSNATYAIYDFLNGTNVTTAAESPIYTPATAGKSSKIAWTGESIYQFLDDAWTPSTPVAVYKEGVYTKGQMS